jgi:AhpD family alkylhydroperoxidase
MSSTIPAGRLQLSKLAPRSYAGMFRLESSIDLPGELRELVKLRASQINRCAFCLDMHWKEARAAGNSEERSYSLDAWRESPLYSDRERAALELTEAMTLNVDDHVPEAVWEQASRQFADEELGQLVFAIPAINAWNRLPITVRMEPGHYQPGQLSEAAIQRRRKRPSTRRFRASSSVCVRICCGWPTATSEVSLRLRMWCRRRGCDWSAWTARKFATCGRG